MPGILFSCHARTLVFMPGLWLQPVLSLFQVSEYIPWIAYNYGRKSPEGYPSYNARKSQKKKWNKKQNKNVKQ